MTDLPGSSEKPSLPLVSSPQKRAEVPKPQKLPYEIKSEKRGQPNGQDEVFLSARGQVGDVTFSIREEDVRDLEIAFFRPELKDGRDTQVMVGDEPLRLDASGGDIGEVADTCARLLQNNIPPEKIIDLLNPKDGEKIEALLRQIHSLENE